jgi:cytochrome b subunit of formate dehydrogenase
MAMKKEKWKKRLELDKSQAKCGCSNFALKVMAIVFGVAFAIFIIIGIALISPQPSTASALVAFGITFLITSIVMTSILCCSCCRIPIEE